MDQPITAAFSECACHSLWGDVHYLRRFGSLLALADTASPFDLTSAPRQRLQHEKLLPEGAPHPATEGLVALIIGAQGIPVHQ